MKRIEKKKKRKTNKEMKYRKTSLFKILLKQIFIKNIKFNFILCILLFIPEIFNFVFNYFFENFVGILNKFIEFNYDYSIIRGALLAILTTININEGYTIFTKEKKWENRLKKEVEIIYLNNLISLNNILRTNYYIPECFYINLFKIGKETDLLIIENIKKDVDKYDFIEQLKIKFKKYVDELNSIYLNIPYDISYDFLYLEQFFYKFINQKKYINNLQILLEQKPKNEKELIWLNELKILIDNFEEDFLEKNVITSNILGKLNLEIRYLQSLINFDIN